MPDSPVAPASVDLADAVAQSVRAGFGLLSLGIDVALRALGESREPHETGPSYPGPQVPASDVADLVLGATWGLARLSGRLAATGARITAPAIDLVLRPPLVPRRLQPAYGVRQVVERWRRDRPGSLSVLGRWSATALPGAVDVALDQMDMHQVAEVVLDRVDLDELVSGIVRHLDVTAITLAVLQEMDLTSVASAAIEETDLDRAVNEALARLRIDEVAARLLDQLDLTQLVLDRVDLDRVVAAALERLDLTTIVIDRVDLDRVVAAALERLDLTAIVIDQVNLGGVVASALEQVDLTQIVMQQVDLLGLAEYVVDGIDLPEIIRDSTGSVASEAVVGLRLQGVDADVAVGRVVDRLLRRTRERRTEKTAQPTALADAPAGPAPDGRHE